MRIYAFIAAATALIGLGWWGAAQAAESGGFPGQWRELERLSLAHSTLVLDAKFECKLVHGKLICGKDVNDDNHKHGDHEHGDNKPKTEKKSGNICEGGGSCPPGYVVLDKPNKYGACCEPKEIARQDVADAGTGRAKMQIRHVRNMAE